MPPKVKFSKESIIDAAFSVVRRDGWGGLTARSIAKELGASTGPIYSYLSSMKDIEEAVVGKVLDLFVRYTTASQTGDPWIDSGIGYVRFALEERQLFQCINDEKHTPVQRKLSRDIWEQLGRDLKGYPLFKGLAEHQVDGIRMARWILVHGLASLINMGWFQVAADKKITFNDKRQVTLEMLIRTFSFALCKGMAEEAKSQIPIGKTR